MPVYRVHICNGFQRLTSVHVGYSPVVFINDIDRYGVYDVDSDDICIDGLFCSPDPISAQTIWRVQSGLDDFDFSTNWLSESRMVVNVPMNSLIINIDIELLTLTQRMKL